MNVEYFCIVSGISANDRSSLIRTHKSSVKTYGEWYEIISKNFIIPNNQEKLFRTPTEKPLANKLKSIISKSVVETQNVDKKDNNKK